MRKSIKKLIAAASAGVMALALAAGIVPAGVNAATATKEAQKVGKAALVTQEGSVDYHAYIWFQCKESWVFRNQWWEEDTGRESDVFNQVSSTLESQDVFKVDGTVQDAEIKGDGTYTVSITGLNGSASAPAGKTPSSEAVFSLLGISTDMPVNEQIKISDIKVKVDGTDKGGVENPTVDEDTKVDPGTMTWDLINAYHEEYPQLSGAMVPRDSVEVTFKISGFGFDNPDAVEPTEAPAATSSTSSSDDADSEGLSSGAVAGIVIVVVIVIAAIVVVVKKKKN